MDAVPLLRVQHHCMMYQQACSAELTAPCVTTEVLYTVYYATHCCVMCDKGIVSISCRLQHVTLVKSQAWVTKHSLEIFKI